MPVPAAEATIKTRLPRSFPTISTLVWARIDAPSRTRRHQTQLGGTPQTLNDFQEKGREAISFIATFFRGAAMGQKHNFLMADMRKALLSSHDSFFRP